MGDLVQDRVGKLAEGAFCVLVLALVAASLYSGLWQRGAVPMDLSPALDLPPWQEARAMGEPATLDTAAALQVERYYPWYAWMNQGGSVLWNNGEGLGEPFLAAWRTRALSPFSLPLYFMELHHALVLSSLLKVLVAGLCAYYAARQFAFPAATALLAAFGFALGAPFVVHSPAPLSDVLPWLPLLFVSAERLILGQWRAWPLCGLVLALMLLGGEPHGAAMIILALPLYVAIRAAGDLRAPSMPRALITVVFAIALAFGLAAVQLFPFREFTDQADMLSGTAAMLGVRDIFAMLHPAFANAPHGAATASLLYLGAVPLLLLPLWLSVREFAQPTQRGRVEAAVLLAVILSLVPCVAGDLLNTLIAHDGPGPEHFLVLNAWAFALLAAAAAQEWIELTKDEARIAFARLVRLLPAIWAMLLGASICGAALAGGGWGGVGMLVAAGVAVFALLAASIFRPNARMLGYGFAIVTAVTMVMALGPLRPVTEGAAVFPETGVVKSLQKIGGRIGGSPRLQEWPLAVNRVDQVFPASGIMLNRLQAFLERTQADPLLMRRTGAQGLLLTTEDIRGPYASVRPVLNIREVFGSGAILFRDNEARPRARMIYAGRRTEKYAPDAVRSDAPPVLESSTLPETDNGPVANVMITEETPTRVTLKVEKSRPAVLVLADAWYPGWRATVDGAPKEVVRVDGLFRGVELGEGAHDVVIEYDPASLKWGMGISALSAVFLLLGVARFIFSAE